MDRDRYKRLEQVFYDVIKGKISINRFNAVKFLESVYSRSGPVACLEKIMASPAGIDGLQNALRANLTADFLNDHTQLLLAYLMSPDLQTVNSGLYLNQLIVKLVEPPIFFDSFRKACLDGHLTEQSCKSLGWLLLQVCTLPTDFPDAQVSDGDSSIPLSTLYRQHRDTQAIVNILLAHPTPSVHAVGVKIERVLEAHAPLTTANSVLGPRPFDRHDNDNEDFRKIHILPSSNEIFCTEQPFLRPSSVLDDPSTEGSRVAIHLDNQFRLLREDMLYEMRDEIQGIFTKKKGNHRAVIITDLYVTDIDCGEEQRRTKWGLVITCNSGIPLLNRLETEEARKDYLLEHRRFLKHQSLTCLVVRGEILAFPSILRNEERLAKEKPEIILQFDEEDGAQRALRLLKMVEVTLVQIDTALFAYKPILKRLQQMTTLPLASELILWKQGQPVAMIPHSKQALASPVIDALRLNPEVDLRHVLQSSKPIILDSSQAASLISGLTQQVSLLQGPPGTGKSFIGALLAKSLFLHTDSRILVVCYTNHALDDILEGLLDIGIPDAKMMRLGKVTEKNEALSAYKQRSRARLTPDQWNIRNDLKRAVEESLSSLKDSFGKYNTAHIHYRDIEALIEFCDPVFHAAFQNPEIEEGMHVAGKSGRAVHETYLMERWRKGQNPGVFATSKSMHDPDIRAVWDMSKAQRDVKWRTWEESILAENIQRFVKEGVSYNEDVEQQIKTQNYSTLLPVLLDKDKRVLGCTTTVAAKYTDEIQAFNPDVLLVEEAGEILESHILTALAPETRQIILIGDHKQLRPKVNNYMLTVEKNEGFDLNRSLFERLILKNYPHETLTHQHRMRPEISLLVRSLTYPELLDADSTRRRPDILGLQDNIIFIHHEKPEGDEDDVIERRDPSATSSKFNMHEVQMILKIVKYLGQQGYGTNDLVILTPYLGQLSKLRQALRADNDPILNDLDSYELVRAGLVNAAEAKLAKKPIRLATIDNYQGEESDIVLVSLTRSNSRADIGFMVSPERLNVLLSRSRNGLIMIGNMDTFMASRKGKELWSKLFDMFKHDRHIYDGFPVKCEQHTHRQSVVKKPEDFDVLCPDGGCDAPCGSKLSCGVHSCPSKCHQLVDHSKMICTERILTNCSNGHRQAYECGAGRPLVCNKCARDNKLAKERQEREDADRHRREVEQQVHLQRMHAIQMQIDAEKQMSEDLRMVKEREKAIQQKQDDLNAMRSFRAQTLAQPSQLPVTPASGIPSFPSNISQLDGKDTAPLGSSQTLTRDVNSSVNPKQQPVPTIPKATSKPFPVMPLSQAKSNWDHRKGMYGLSNASVDAIMAMTGLEGVKDQILEILDKVESTSRQGASFKNERFNAVLLGNPGTGKTTIARYYARFLASVGVVPGDTFIETTGASLSHEGVDGAKKKVEGLKSSGGAMFIDEAYQLTSGHNAQGPAVLDYLLAEIENNIGAIVFLLAGYTKEMEKFFQHNPGLNSRIPYQLKFADYKDEELMAMFQDLISKTWNGRMRVEDGTGGLYSRILIRRLGRRRSRPGFGNARELQIIFAQVRGRQAKRLAKARQTGQNTDDFFLSGEDLIGPDPSEALTQSVAWTKLQGLTGLKAVKQSVTALLHLIQENYRRELMEKEPMEISLNRVFLGSPGTGKTTVARLYGQILADLQLLSNGEVIEKNPSDFIGAVIGASEANTKAILSNAVGKVLIIDEAYMLYGGGSGTSDAANNQYKTSVIDTIVAEVQNVPGDDRCVLMLGYKDQMVEMFQKVNPGLSRRFKIEDAFNFEDFDNQELLRILSLKLNDQDLDATDAAKAVAIDVLDRLRNRPNFGNAGDVENVISAAKERCLKRRDSIPLSERHEDIVFEPEDFDPDYNRAARASTNLQELFSDIIGYEDIVQRLANYIDIARACKDRRWDIRERIPTNFIFTGPPGTGKTTVARKMGQVFFDMGMLASAEVVECSASDMVGSYVGHTGPKTRALFERALGKVLFIDEAYRLAGGHFAQEAVDEVVALLTHEKFRSRLIVILAGYEQDINLLMSTNAGLSSRFPDQFFFHNMDPDRCIEVVSKQLEKNDVYLDGIDNPRSVLYQDVKDLIIELTQLDDWGNARDMMTLSKDLINRALIRNLSPLSIGVDETMNSLRKMVNDRRRRTKKGTKTIRQQPSLPVQTFTPTSIPPAMDTGTNTNTAQPPSAESTRASTPTSTASTRGRGRGRSGRGRGRGQATPPRGPPSAQSQTEAEDERDAGVSDEVWRQLQAAKIAAAQVERNAQNAIRLAEQMEANERKREQQAQEQVKALEKAEKNERDAEKRRDLARKREEARLRAHAARVAKEKAAAELRNKQEAERKRRELEEKAQRKLREMGVCVAGYRWIPQGDIYRCAGGSHVVAKSQLGL